MTRLNFVEVTLLHCCIIVQRLLIIVTFLNTNFYYISIYKYLEAENNNLKKQYKKSPCYVSSQNNSPSFWTAIGCIHTMHCTIN
jgi:hypothetical protein